MPGIPGFISDGPWWGIFAFLFMVVLLRAQATYWLGRKVRDGAASLAHDAGDASRRARLTRRFTGPGMDRAQAFLDRWGFVGIPISFLTVGFQTMVNAAAGYGRMRWDLYTVAMIPGCLAWATMYTLLALSIWRAATLGGAQSGWVMAGAVLLLVAVSWLATRLRQNGGSGSRTPQ